MHRILIVILFFVLAANVSSFAQEKNNAPQSAPKKSSVHLHHHKHYRKITAHRHSKKNKADTAVVPRVERRYPTPGSSGEDLNYDWYRQRAFPNNEIDPNAYANALEQAKNLPVYEPSSKFTTQANSSWQQIGPYKIGGRVTAIATHPTDSNTFYVGGAAGGLWKTTDHGMTWRALTDNFSAISVGCITIDPSDANTIYLGMGECNSSSDSYPGNGLWRSTDAGNNWSLLGLSQTQYISKVIVSPTNRNTIWVCVPGPNADADSNRGIWKSTDFGATWNRSLLVRAGKGRFSTPVPAIDLVINPRDTNDLVAAMWQKVTSAGTSVYVPYNGLWRTRDGGADWNRIDTITGSGFVNGISYKRLSRISLLWTLNCLDSATPVLYAVTSKVDKDPITGYALAENFCALFKTNNPESGWKVMLDSSYRLPFLGNNIDSVDLFNRQGGYDNLIVGNPRQCNEIYIGGIDVIRSTDAGATWTNITNAYPHYFENDRTQHSDQHALAFTAGTNDLLNGQDGGVFNTRNFGATWSRIDGLPITMFYHLEPWYGGMANVADPMPIDSLKFFGGTQDNGTVGHGFTANTDWDWINRGDGGQAQSDPNNSNHIVTSLQLGKIFFRTTIDSLRPNLFSDNGNHDPSAKKWYEMLTIMRRRGITDSSEACAFIPPVVLDKQNGVDLYTGRTSIYRIKMNFTDPDSLTNIWKWSPQIAGAPGSPKLWYYGEVEAIALGARDNNGRPMIWTGTINNGGRNIWRTTLNESLPADSMPKWIRADVAGLPGLFPTWIRASLRDSMAAYVSFSGFNTDTAKGHIDSIGHLFRTLDGGKTWKSISGKNTAVGLPNAPVNAFVIDTLAEHGDSTKRGQCIIAAMDVGVFITTDGGNTWSQLGTGMPHLVVGTLTMYRNWLVAGTHGRSAWAIDVGGINAVSRGVTNEPIATNNFTITSVYPNPASSIIHVRLSATSPTTLELFDLKGVPLLHQQTNGATADILLPGNILTGTYILRAINSNGEPAEAKVQIVR